MIRGWGPARQLLSFAVALAVLLHAAVDLQHARSEHHPCSEKTREASPHPHQSPDDADHRHDADLNLHARSKRPTGEACMSPSSHVVLAIAACVDDALDPKPVGLADPSYAPNPARSSFLRRSRGRAPPLD